MDVAKQPDIVLEHLRSPQLFMPVKTFRISVISSCFRGEKYLASFLNQLSSQTIFSELQWVLVHNEPTSRELEIVKKFQEEFPQQVKHLVVQPVESLSASWNRGWTFAGADYISFWNLDDCRPPDALQRQVEALEKNPDCAMSYGDYLEVSQYGDTTGQERKTPFPRVSLLRRVFPGGAFMVWRKNVDGSIGRFDEQLTVACDYDLVTRAAVSGLKMCKITGLVGYFTNEGKGLSTDRRSNKDLIESAIVQLRYGMFDKVRPEYSKGVAPYQISEILVDGKWIPLSDLVKDYSSYVQRRTFLQKINPLRRFIMKALRGKG